MNNPIDDITDFASLSNLKYQLNRQINKIKQEFSHHLDSINENTNEIQSNFEYLSELDKKIEKLTVRVEKIQMYLFKERKMPVEVPSYNIQELTDKEKNVFIVLYTTMELVSYSQIADKTNLPINVVMSYVTNLIEKGIHIVKKYISGKAYVGLDQSFREEQARNNIVKINQKTIQNF